MSDTLFPLPLRPLEDALNGRYELIDEIARGRTGLTWRVQAKGHVGPMLCLKTIKDDLEDKAEFEDVRATLRKEVEILSPLHHRCLPQVFFADFDCELPYYICTYHPGKTFKQFASLGKTIRFDEASVVIQSLIDVLSYLHKHNRQHDDLHANNVLIGEDTIREGILLIDFGSGHRLSDPDPETTNRGHGSFKDTRGRKAGRSRVNRVEFQDSFRSSDFNAFGKLLQTMEGSFVGGSSQHIRFAYRDLWSELVAGDLQRWTDVRERFRDVVNPYRPLSENDDLFAPTEGGEQRVILPTSSGVRVGTKILPTLNSRVVQRLRGLKQLSFCDWHFPGANHTRFEHSLGVFGLAREAIGHLMHQQQFRDWVDPLGVRGFYLAAMIHDVGHYPFAHVVEQYARSRFHDNRKVIDEVQHEENSKRLMNQDSELQCAIADDWGDECLAEAVRIISGKAGVLSKLLDGPIDIDKLDYLHRDAAHCGLGYAGGFSQDQILQSYTCTDGGDDLGVYSTGVGAASGMMIFQDQMLVDVYWKEEVRSVIAMFHALLKYVVGTGPSAMIELVAKLQSVDGEDAAFREVLIPAVNERRHINDDGAAKERATKLVTALHQKSYADMYKAIAVCRPTDRGAKAQRIDVYNSIVAAQQTSHSQVPVDFDQVKRLRESFEHALKSAGIDCDSSTVTVDVPYGKASRSRFKAVDEATGREADFLDFSHLGESIFDAPAQHASPIRVYVEPSIAERIAGTTAAIQAAAHEKYGEI